MRRRVVIDRSWPSWRYGPNGEAQIFQTEADVPRGWTRKPGVPEEPRPSRETVVLNRDELVATLQFRGVDISPLWGVAHMKRIIDGDVSPTG